MLDHHNTLSFSTLVIFIVIGLITGCTGEPISDQVIDVTKSEVTETVATTNQTVLPTMITTIPEYPSPLSTRRVITTSTPPPEAMPTPVPSSLFPTVTPLEKWLVYKNNFYGYQFSYPPEAKISVAGVISYPPDEKPENISHDTFLEQLRETYPDDICVTIRYMTGFVTIRAPLSNGGRYTSHCGTSGVGADYDIVEKTEVVTVNGERYISEGVELFRAADETRVVRELFYVYLPDGTQIHYGRAVEFPDEGNVKEVLMQIISSYH